MHPKQLYPPDHASACGCTRLALTARNSFFSANPMMKARHALLPHLYEHDFVAGDLDPMLQAAGNTWSSSKHAYALLRSACNASAFAADGLLPESAAAAAAAAAALVVPAPCRPAPFCFFPSACLLASAPATCAAVAEAPAEPGPFAVAAVDGLCFALGLALGAPPARSSCHQTPYFHYILSHFPYSTLQALMNTAKQVSKPISPVPPYDMRW